MNVVFEQVLVKETGKPNRTLSSTKATVHVLSAADILTVALVEKYSYGYTSSS